MIRIVALNKIDPEGLKRLPENYEITDKPEEADAILVRSADMHSLQPGENLLAVARAGAGTNNIPTDEYADQGIVVFNTPGANSNAVKELVVGGLIMAARNIPEGEKWLASLPADETLKKAVEKGKSQFKGTELMGKTVAVSGLGAVGARVANACADLDMNVVGFDAFMNPKMALTLNPSIRLAASNEEMVKDADYVTIHVPALPATKGMFDKHMFDQMKDGVVLLNYSRDALVNEADLLAALDSGKISKYITDFATPGILGHERVHCLPHMGASTKEAELNCAIMAATELKDYIENGNINKSVNYPAVDLGPKQEGETRIAVLLKDVENPADAVIQALSAAGITIDAVKGADRRGHGYALVSTSSEVETLPEIPGAVRCRVIK